MPLLKILAIVGQRFLAENYKEFQTLPVDEGNTVSASVDGLRVPNHRWKHHVLLQAKRTAVSASCKIALFLA